MVNNNLLLAADASPLVARQGRKQVGVIPPYFWAHGEARKRQRLALSRKQHRHTSERFRVTSFGNRCQCILDKGQLSRGHSAGGRAVFHFLRIGKLQRKHGTVSLEEGRFA